MNVGQLVKALQKHQSDTLVVVSGYEGGVDEVGVCRLVEIELNVHPHDHYYGLHKVYHAGDSRIKEHTYVPAIRITA